MYWQPYINSIEFWFTLPNAIEKSENLSDEKINFSDQELELLKPVLIELRNKNIYEVSAIKKVLLNFKSESTAIEKWKDRVEETVFLSDNAAFTSLLNL